MGARRESGGAKFEDIFDVGAEDFGGGSGGGESAAGGVGLVAVEELADFADALFLHVFQDAGEHFVRGFFGFFAAAVEFDVGADQWAQQPGKGGALVVSAVARD